MRESVLEILSARKKLHPNDPSVKRYWQQLTAILCLNETETIVFLKSCNEDEILWISEVFDEVSEGLQSHNLIKCLRELDKKFPNAKLKDFIDSAENYID